MLCMNNSTFIINIDTLANNSKELYDLVKVFINGAWVGITNEPLELYNNLKEKNTKKLLIFIHQLYLTTNYKKLKYVMMLED